MVRYYSRARRRRGKPMLVWSLVLLVVAVGAWQIIRFQKALMADARQMSRAPATEPAGTIPAETRSAGRGMTSTMRGDVRGAPAMQLVPVLSPKERAARIEHLRTAARSALDAHHIVDARNALNQLLMLLGEDEEAAAVRADLASMNIHVFIGTDVLPNDTYACTVPISTGDNFPKLASRYRIPAALIQWMNPGLDPRRLQINSPVKIVYGPFHLKYVKHAARLDLFARDMYICSAPATIESAFMVPTGDYRIKPGGKLQFSNGAAGRTWMEFAGVDSETDAIHSGWLYGSAGARSAGNDRIRAGILLGDSDIATLYNTLVEGDSFLHVEP